MVNRFIFIVGLGLTLNGLKAQTLYIPDSATVFVGKNAEILSGGDTENNGHVDNQGEFSVSGDAQNNGQFDNIGNINLSGDWLNSGVYNGISGGFTLTGNRMQQIFNDDIQISNLIIDSGDTVVLEGNRAEVFDTIDFRNGILKTSASNQLIIDNGARVMANQSGSSYFEGRLILQGGSEIPGDSDTPFKFFPLGDKGRYAPITFSSIEEAGFYELAVTFITPNSQNPEPDSTLIGVSDQSIWLIEPMGQAQGVIDSALVEIDFMDENLTDFTNINDINADIKSPVIAESNSPQGPYTTLGVGQYTGDSISFGDIVSAEKIFLGDNMSKYVAVALAPQIPDEVEVFIPEAFSPAASQFVNRSFLIFGINVREENFRMVVFSSFNKVVYQSSSFLEASTKGWNGLLKNGNDAPAGLYFYAITLIREDGTPEGKSESYNGPVYLVR